MTSLRKQQNVANLYKKQWYECQYNLTVTVKHNMTNFIWDIGWYEPSIIKDGRAEQYNSIWKIIRTEVLTKIKDKVNEEI